MPDIFTIDSLIRRGIFRHAVAAEYRLDGKRLGSLELPDPWGTTTSHNGRSRKRALEILILASAFGAAGYADVDIEDDNGRSERPDFRARLKNVGEIGVEVTQLRSKTSAARATAAKKFQDLLRDELNADPELARAYSQMKVNVQPSPNWLASGSQKTAAAAVIGELRRQMQSSQMNSMAIPFFVSVHQIPDKYAPLRGLFVSAPLPPYGEASDIDVARLVNEKRIDAREYAVGVPVWLVVGITADFGQLEVSLDDAAVQVDEALPFQNVLVANGQEVRVIRATAFPLKNRSDKDVLGRAWHEAGHAVAALRLGIPLVSTTIERSFGSERGFTEISGDVTDAMHDALFTAAGQAAQATSGFSPHHIAEAASFDDRLTLEKVIAPRLGITDPAQQYHFADQSLARATDFVHSNLRAIDEVGKRLSTKGTLSAKECAQIIGANPAT